jgi:putative toxin-antitoxin system antitoxin component (TIGR02293 family)
MVALQHRNLSDLLGPDAIEAQGSRRGFHERQEPVAWSGPAAAPRLVQLVRDGIPVAAVDHFLQTGAISAVELHELVLPRKTLANRREMGRLNPEQSDRLLRVARLFVEAEEVFGAPAKAHEWLRRGNAALEGQRPLDLLDTDEGVRLVVSLLGRISHGIAA